MTTDVSDGWNVQGPWLVIVVALLAVVIAHATHGLPFSWDDQGQYLSHARALLEGRVIKCCGA